MAAYKEAADLLGVAWHSLQDVDDVLNRLGTSFDGLSPEEASTRLAKCVTLRRGAVRAQPGFIRQQYLGPDQRVNRVSGQQAG